MESSTFWDVVSSSPLRVDLEGTYRHYVQGRRISREGNQQDECSKRNSIVYRYVPAYSGIGGDRLTYTPKKDAVTVGCIQVHNSELLYFYPLRNVIRIITSWKMRWEDRVVITGETRSAYTILIRITDRKRRFEMPGRKLKVITGTNLDMQSGEMD